jgi:6-phosphogluconolactonase
MIAPDDPSRTPEAYALSEDALPAPALPGTVVVAPTVDRLIDLVAADLLTHAANCIRQFGDFHLALSGGSTPQPLYERLMYDPSYRSLPWRRTHLWIVDERRVPFDDDRSNFKAISETIVDHADIPPEQVHPMFAMSETADVDYEQQIREELGWREKGQDRFDYVLLGMGADGHTASLFPQHEVLEERDRLVRICTGPRVTPPDRVTLTLPMINAARLIGVMVTGMGKAEAIEAASHGADVREMPVMGINPVGGELKWYVDAAAASLSC